MRHDEARAARCFMVFSGKTPQKIKVLQSKESFLSCTSKGILSFFPMYFTTSCKEMGNLPTHFIGARSASVLI
jgi:hypothetical protein